MTIAARARAELGYQCRRNIELVDWPLSNNLEAVQCRGRMVDTWHVATRVPSVTCDSCNRVAAREPVRR